MLLDKVLVICVTRNNPVLLQHMFESFLKYSPGYECDYLIVDHESDNKGHLLVLDSLSKKHKVVKYENSRVEVSFDKAYKGNKNYKYYFFLHDDSAANRDNWLGIFVNKLNSQYSENIIQTTHMKDYKIGRVGAMHQPWRSYSSILGYPVQCVFLEKVLELIRPNNVPKIFKHCDPDRCLVSNECLEATNGIRNVNEFKTMEYMNNDQYEKLCLVLKEYLPYHDEGIPPRDKYPPGQCWNKLVLLSEFMNSVEPLIKQYRTVGLEGDGFLEQIHGYDEPWGHNFVSHYGAPNMKQFMGRIMNTDSNEVQKHFNNKVFLLKCDKAIKDYFSRRSQV